MTTAASLNSGNMAKLDIDEVVLTGVYYIINSLAAITITNKMSP